MTNRPQLTLCLGLLLGACSADDGGRIDLFLDRSGCSPGCDVDRFDIYIARQGCLYAWRLGLGGGELELAALDIDEGQQVTVEVLARCGNDSCVRCTARQTFSVGDRDRVDLPLGAASSCAVTPATTAPCGRCLPGPDAYCDGDHSVACPGSGQTQRTPCPKGCVDGACATTCSKVFYRDADGDTWGDGAQQQTACTRPAGSAEQGGDCDDNDAKVHPGQSAYFTVPTPNKGGFDYNCDGTNEKEYDATVSCHKDASGACVGSGWYMLVPLCGGDGVFSACEVKVGLCTQGLMLPRRQACR